MHEFLKTKLERYLRVNLLGPGPRLVKKICRTGVSQMLRNTALHALVYRQMEIENERMRNYLCMYV
jgi:hypothetical protein